MKVAVIYYDGNDFKAKGVNISSLDHPKDLAPLGLGLGNHDVVQGIVQVPDGQDFLYLTQNFEGMPVVLLSGDETCKVLDIEEAD